MSYIYRTTLAHESFLTKENSIKNKHYVNYKPRWNKKERIQQKNLRSLIDVTENTAAHSFHIKQAMKHPSNLHQAYTILQSTKEKKTTKKSETKPRHNK